MKKRRSGLGAESAPRSDRIDVLSLVEADGSLINMRRLIEEFVSAGDAKYVTDTKGDRRVQMTASQAMALGETLLKTVTVARAIQLRNRIAPRRVDKLALRALDIAVWFLPAAEQARYAEEYQAEWCEVARGSRWSQWGFVVRLVFCAPLLGRELRRAAREAVSEQ